MFSNEIFRYIETKTSTENRDNPPYQSFFDTRNYCNSKGFPYGNFRHCETKNFRRKILILPPLIQTFSIPEINETLKDSTPYGNFRHCETKNFRQKNLNPPPLLSINFFATGNFLKHSTEGFTYQIFRHCETKNFERKVVHRIQKAVVELMFVENFRKLDFKQ